MFRQTIVAAAIFGLLAAPVVAQGDAFITNGIAVAQAPEAALGLCFGPEAVAAIQCAQDDCMARSGLGAEDCAANLWCFPHGWTAHVAVTHVEGIGWAKILCDSMTREDLDRAVALYCDQPAFADCKPVRIWDHDGNAVLDYPED